ncbi:MAG: DUF3482 domain-containing protein, partial [Bdellovibrionales bacterium]|nr:DUF3482 domain-containing protein [Bdellovibrionales bacterium]
IDAALGGASVLLGTLLGSGAGGIAALRSAKAVASIRFFNTPLGSTKAVLGPSRSVELPHVLYNRARLHHFLVAGRTHAERSELRLDVDPASILSPLTDSDRRKLERIFRSLRSDAAEGRNELAQLTLELFRRDTLNDSHGFSRPSSWIGYTFDSTA